MSWDAILLRLPQDVTTVAELGDGEPDPLGSTDEVRNLLCTVLPDLDLSDPAWGILESSDYSIEFSIGKEEPCTSIMLHVRGLDSAIEPIRAVCAQSKWQALDCSTGELIDFDSDPAQGLRAWRAYRNKVAPGGPAKGFSLSTPDGGRVFFDGPPTPARKTKPQRRPWWQFWKRNG